MFGIDDIIMGGASILGGLLGGKKGATNQTTSNAKSMDPRVESMYFGSNGSGGLLGDLNNWYSQNKTGLNSDMQAGLDHMKSVYQSPLATQGYDRMANTGYDLMGRGVAQNPFTSGQMPNFGNLQAGAYQQPTAQPAQPAAQPTQNLGLSLSNGWAQPTAPAAPAQTPAAPAQNQLTSQEQFQKMYEEEMKRRQDEFMNSSSGNWKTTFGG